MLTEIDIGGVYVAPIVIYAAMALAIFSVLRAILRRSGVLAALWHAALFDLALYVAVLAALVLYL